MSLVWTNKKIKILLAEFPGFPLSRSFIQNFTTKKHIPKIIIPRDPVKIFQNIFPKKFSGKFS